MLCSSPKCILNINLRQALTSCQNVEKWIWMNVKLTTFEFMGDCKKKKKTHNKHKRCPDNASTSEEWVSVQK